MAASASHTVHALRLGSVGSQVRLPAEADHQAYAPCPQAARLISFAHLAQAWSAAGSRTSILLQIQSISDDKLVSTGVASSNTQQLIRSSYFVCCFCIIPGCVAMHVCHAAALVLVVVAQRGRLS